VGATVTGSMEVERCEMRYGHTRDVAATMPAQSCPISCYIVDHTHVLLLAHPYAH
jgi:hypothetical protein